MKVSAVILHKDDTVACLLRDHHSGEALMLASRTGPTLIDDVQLGHKVALVVIPKGEPIVKYGALIGIATTDIVPGEHVHLHNLQGTLR